MENESGSAATGTLTVNVASGSQTFSGILRNGDGAGTDGTLALTKTGAGTQVLTGSNTYTGATTVQAGTLSFSVGNALATADQQLGKNTDLDLGVAATSSGTLLYTGSSGTLAKNVNALGNGNNTIENNGGGTLTLSGTLAKNGTTLVLKNTNANSQIIVSNAITGASANSDLVVSGGTTTLNAASSYVGPTSVIGAGTLALGINNAIPSNSAVTLGDATTTGTLNMSTFTNSIGSLAFGAAGGTLKLTANQTSSAQLAASGAVAFGSSNTLDLTGMSTTAGLYKLVSGSSLSGTFGTVTGLNTDYTLKYGTVNANELDAQHKADQSFAFTVPSGTPRALVSTNVSLTGTLTNTAPSGSAALAAALTSTGTLTVGSLSSSTGATVAVGSPSTITGSVATGATVGTFGWNVRNTDANALTSAANISGSIAVVNQRTFSVGTDPIALGRFLISGTPAGTTAISSSGLNAVTADASLGSFSAVSGLTLTTGDSTTFNGGAASQTANYTVGGTASSAGAISGTFSSVVTAELGSISNVTVGVTGNALATRTVTAPATTSLGTYHAGAAVNVTSNGFGYTYGAGGTGAHSDTEDTSVLAYSGAADANGITLSGGTNSISTAGTFTRSFTGTAAISSSGGSFSSTVNPEFSASTSVGAAYTIGVYSGNMIYSGASGGSFATGGNWTDSVSGGAQAAPGLAAGFTGVDSATFGNTAGNVIVSLNGSSPSLNAITFNNTGSYTIATGSGGAITMAGTTPTISSAGTQEIAPSVILGANTTAFVASGGTLTASGFVSETGGARELTKTGTGTLTVTNANTYSGGTTVSAGTLEVNNTSGSGTGSGTVTVNGTLAGEGSITTGINNYVYLNGTLQVGSLGATQGTDFSLTTSGTGSTVLVAHSSRVDG